MALPADDSPDSFQDELVEVGYDLAGKDDRAGIENVDKVGDPCADVVLYLRNHHVGELASCCSSLLLWSS